MATTSEKILNALNMYNQALQSQLDKKFVRQEGGKGLSTNDYTDEEKEKVRTMTGGGSGGAEIKVGKDPPDGGIWIDTSSY